MSAACNSVCIGVVVTGGSGPEFAPGFCRAQLVRPTIYICGRNYKLTSWIHLRVDVPLRAFEPVAKGAQAHPD
jgi:hypothetical protein